MKFALLAVIPLMIAAMGCSTIVADINLMPDDVLAAHVETVAKEGAVLAIGFATWKDPSKAVQIGKDAAVGDQLLRGTLIPMFQNAPLGTVLAGGIAVARQQLQAKLAGSPADALALVASTALAGITVPSAGYLSPRMQKVIAASFLGLAEGIESSMGIPGPSTPPGPPPAPPVAPAPPPPVPSPQK
jgi:hypothetical protein